MAYKLWRYFIKLSRERGKRKFAGANRSVRPKRLSESKYTKAQRI